MDEEIKFAKLAYYVFGTVLFAVQLEKEYRARKAKKKPSIKRRTRKRKRK